MMHPIILCLQASAEDRLDQLTGPQLARLLWGLMVLGVKPTLPWLYTFEDASRTLLQGTHDVLHSYIQPGIA
jgi:hypothetical protein